jgi:NTP pyrophosphatase (non-canonical NTP hydrolase)
MDKETTYYIYHIPGKKIGVTRNLNDRVTYQQGYKPSEYEVLESSEDINYISSREIELQKSYGYKVDRKLYKNLFEKMKINATQETSTFPFPLSELKSNLMENLGKSWETTLGTFRLNKDTVTWIIDNARTSMYNAQRSYIYNKAYYEEFVNFIEQHNGKLMDKYKEETERIIANLRDKIKQEPTSNGSPIPIPVFERIRVWAKQRGLYKKGDSKTQYVKLQEEAGELAKALLKRDHEEIVDAIGDIVVVLTNLAHLEGFKIEECVESAYKVIAERTGQMLNGTFVKDN